MIAMGKGVVLVIQCLNSPQSEACLDSVCYIQQVVGGERSERGRGV